MTPANTRSALSALDAVRPLIVRLDERRHPEDAAADLIEGWSGVETALRAMVGGSSLAGQALVSDVRAAGLLDYPHAHALLGFLAARDRATRPDYQPNAEDVAAARAGFQAIEAANGSGIAANTDTHPTPTQTRATASPPLPPPPAPPLAPPAAPVLRPPAPPATRASATAPLAPPPARESRLEARAEARQEARYDEPLPAPRRSPLLLLGLLTLVLALGAGAYYLFGPTRRGGGALDEGVAAYQAGRRGDARRHFDDAARANPKLALPHVYLGRMAREDGDFARATTELTTALSLDPASALAAREMGSVQLVSGRPDLAVRFFTRALERDGTDRLAAGGMACALMQQGNTVAADRFFARAGSGSWDVCRQMAPGAPLPNGMLPGAPGAAPGAVPPAGRVPLAPAP